MKVDQEFMIRMKFCVEPRSSLRPVVYVVGEKRGQFLKFNASEPRCPLHWGKYWNTHLKFNCGTSATSAIVINIINVSFLIKTKEMH